MRRMTFLSAAMLAAAPAHATGTDGSSPGSVAEGPAVVAVNGALGLAASRLADLDVPARSTGEMLVGIPLATGEALLRLRPSDPRSATYRLTTTGLDGLVEHQPGSSTIVRGRIDGDAGSVIAGSLGPDGLTARLETGDGTAWFIEPIAGHIAGVGGAGGGGGAGGFDHVIYAPEDVIAQPGSCGTIAGAIDHVGSATGGVQRGTGPGLFIAELAVECDIEYYRRYGSSVPSVESRVMTIISVVNMQYERDVEITHEIAGIHIWTANPDPYTADEALPLAQQFRSHWQVNGSTYIPGGYDVAHMFTGQFLNGQFIGYALSIGGICGGNAYCVSESDWAGSLACATDLTAHELGHLWNGSHCACVNPAWTMNPNITCINRFNPLVTIPSITAHRNSVACLEQSVPIAPFAAIEPIDGAMGVETGPLFDWEDTTGQDSYTVTVARDTALTDLVFSITVSPSRLQASPGTFDEGTTYYWKVDANPFAGDDVVTGSPGISSFTTLETVKPCPGDVNGNRVVDAADLSVLIGSFGQDVPPGTMGDINGDGTVNAADLSIVIGFFSFTCD